jgi:polysaccharide export outer membrane protein
MRTVKRLGLVVLALFALSACGPTLSSMRVEGTETTAATADIPDEARGPRVANGDTLRVTVFNEPQLSGDFVVNKTGGIAFPLIGQTHVVGLDTLEIEQRLKQQLDGRFLVNPKVGVELLNQRPFYIMGEVTKAGEYPFRPGLNVVGAIATAGGFSPRAETKRVSIRRNGATQAQDYPVQPNIAVYPGDMITIPERLF